MRRAVNGVGDADSISDWYASIPIITKVMVTSTVAIAGALSLGVVDPFQLIFEWNMVKNRFQIWRLFSACVFAGGFSFNFVMVLLHEAFYSSR